MIATVFIQSGKFEELSGLELTAIREGRAWDSRQDVASFTEPEIRPANTDIEPECWPLRLGSPLTSVISSLKAIMLPSWLFCGVTGLVHRCVGSGAGDRVGGDRAGSRVASLRAVFRHHLVDGLARPMRPERFSFTQVMKALRTMVSSHTRKFPPWKASK